MESVQDRMRVIEVETRGYKQNLATAMLAVNETQNRFCRTMLLKKQDEKFNLWQHQAPGESCHQLVHMGLRVYLKHSIQSSTCSCGRTCILVHTIP